MKKEQGTIRPDFGPPIFVKNKLEDTNKPLLFIYSHTVSKPVYNSNFEHFVFSSMILVLKVSHVG